MAEQDESLRQRFLQAVRDLVFVGFHSQVVALHRDTGEMVWDWKCPEGTSEYVALLLDGDRLIVSVHGYTYCLNALNGEQIWANPLRGYGIGVPSLVSVNGTSGLSGAAAEVLAEAARAAAAAGS